MNPSILVPRLALVGLVGLPLGCGDDPESPADSVDASVDATTVDAAPPPPDAPPVCTDCAWLQRQRLEASDGRRSDRFGDKLAIDDDLLVVASKNHDLGDLDEGSAYVFERQGDNWVETAKLVAPDADRNDEFGRSVGASGDTAVVGAWQDKGSGDNAGAVYVYDKTDTGFGFTTKLVPDDAGPNMLFGNDLVIVGEVMAVAAFYDGNQQTGAVYMFERTDGVWSQSAKLVPAGLSGQIAQFGAALAFDGNTVVASAPLKDGTGAVYVFERDGASWRETASLTRPNGLQAGDTLGYNLTVRGDVIVAGVQRTGQVSGIGYVYRRGSGDWALESSLEGPSATYGDFFGEVAAVGADSIIMGAHRSEPNGVVSAGAIHEFRLQGGTWTLTESMNASPPVLNEAFGFSLAIDGDTLVVGAESDVAYIFERNPDLP